MPIPIVIGEGTGGESDSLNKKRTGIQQISGDGGSICSFAQERLWFINQLNRESAAYNISGGIRLTGELDTQILTKCFGEIVLRHEILRARFRYEDGKVFQVVGSTGVKLELTDLSDLGEEERNDTVRRQLEAEAQQVFDLALGPLFRVKLLRLSAKEHVLLLTMHHIISDGWSTVIITHELTHLYGAVLESRPSPLATLEIQYADYALWQREHLRGSFIDEQLQYWRQQLDGANVFELPIDRPRRSVSSPQSASVPIGISKKLTEQLLGLSRRNGVTLFMTLLAGFQIVLARYSGSADVIVGSPISSRPREAERLVGCFLNTLVLRTDLSGNPRVRELLKRVRQTALEAYAHQDIPFEKLVEELHPERDLNRSPFFSVVFAFQVVPSESSKLPGLKVEFLIGDSGTAKFDLTLSLDLIHGELRGKMDYKVDLFAEDKINRFLGHLRRMFEVMVEEEEKRVMDIPLLSPEERRLLLEEWNATETEYPSHQSVHQLFEEQVRKSPDAVAVVCGDESLSYAGLNEQANRLAHYLIGLGVKPDDRVGICVERSLGMVVGLLGILKSGGAYVPLDPAYPTERLRQVLADAAPKILLSDAAGREALGEESYSWLTVVELESNSAVWEGEPVTDPDPQQLGLRSDNLAYVIYTSGSTGIPKGVMVEHAQVSRLFSSTDEAYAFTDQDVWCLFHSCAFDFSVWELWGALGYGGRLIVVPREVARSSEEFYRLVCDEGVTVLNQTPSAFRGLIEAQAEERRPDQLRYVIFGGEGLEPTILKPWYRSHTEGQPQLVNMYGITETTVHVTYRALNLRDSEENGSPIGKRLPDLRIYLLDEYGEPVPLGAVGELYVGGAGVARGYLKRPELTAERFLADGFSPEGGARMYKTGDLGRYLPDGNIEFLGRNDNQVKIRGFRIELGEIEARLGEHPLVRQAVVVAREDAPGEKRLVAYVIPTAPEQRQEESLESSLIGTTNLAAALRTHLAGCLPEYMVPVAFVHMNELQLTPNGKIDRKKLPVPDIAAFVRQAYEAPQYEMEHALAELWQELLNVERVGRHDNFFELGGHSLLAVQLMVRVRQVLGVELSMVTLFAKPTIAQLAQIIAESSANDNFHSFPPLTKISRHARLPLSFAQQRLWFLAQMEDVSVTYHIPAALHLRWDLDRAALRKSLDALMARHEALRSVFVAVEGEPHIELLPEEMGLPWIEHDLRDEPDAWEQLTQLSKEEARTPFDLSRGPLIRARLIRMGEQEYVFLLTQHHIVSDGASLGVLIQELNTLYRAFQEQRPDPLPPLAIQYPDYAAWQREWLSGERLQRQSDYWRQALADAP